MIKLVYAAVAGVLSALVWIVWFSWDTESTLNQGGDSFSSPYQGWQFLGAAISIFLILWFGRKVLHPLLLALTVSIFFTVAYGATVYPADETGLSLIGVLLMGFGSLVVATILVGLMEALSNWRKKNSSKSDNDLPVS